MCLCIVAFPARGAACISCQPVMKTMRLCNVSDRRESQRKTRSNIRRPGGCVVACDGALRKRLQSTAMGRDRFSGW